MQRVLTSFPKLFSSFSPRTLFAIIFATLFAREPTIIRVDRGEVGVESGQTLMWVDANEDRCAGEGWCFMRTGGRLGLARRCQELMNRIGSRSSSVRSFRKGLRL